MTHALCRSVPLALGILVALGAVAGCADAHGLGANADSGPTLGDAGVDAFVPPAADASIDAIVQVPDAGSCAPRAIDFACTDRGNGAVPVGVPFELPVFLGDGTSCLCGEIIGCSSRVADGVIDLTTAQCSDLLCDGCFPVVRGSCAIAALTAGTYRVRVDGVDAMEVTASDAVPAIGPVDSCFTVGDDHGCGLTWSPHVEEIDMLCRPLGPPSREPFFVDVTASVVCGAIPECEVQRSASSLSVTLRTVPTNCDVDCGGPTFPITVSCAVPPLEPGDYTLTTASGLSSSLTIDPSTTSTDDVCTARLTTFP